MPSPLSIQCASFEAGARPTRELGETEDLSRVLLMLSALSPIDCLLLNFSGIADEQCRLDAESLG
jgi:hypothetical protein